MYKTHEFLLELGLNGKEVKSYLALLKLGRQPASVIAKKINIPRSSTVFLLDSLTKKNFALKSSNDKNTNYYSPIKPSDIKNLLEHERRKLSEKLEEFSDIEADLASLISPFIPVTNIKFFEGVDGICRMIDETLEKDQPIYFISAHDLHKDIKNYIQKVYVPIRKRMKTKCQMVIANKEYTFQTKDLYDWMGYLDSEKPFDLKSTIAIYSDTVQLMNCNGKDIGGVQIENSYIAKTMKAVFNLLKYTKKVEKVNK